MADPPTKPVPQEPNQGAGWPSKREGAESGTGRDNAAPAPKKP
jgi:hypothetical protein